MSFGFGFALPAYPLRGGGGNNPFNQLGPTLDLSFTGVVTDLTDPNGYTLNTDFIIPQYQIAAQYVVWETGVGLVSKNFSDIITFTRASTATYFDSAGVLQSAAIDAPRFDYDPDTLAAQGLLIEEARTNSIRNNTMQGAVAGTPGTNPTNWTISPAAGNLTTKEIVGIGTEGGVTYIDVRFVASGVVTASIYADSATGVPASNGQAWTSSFYIKLAGGSLTNVTVRLSIVENDSGGNFLAGSDGPFFVPTAAALNTQRQQLTRTNTNASTAYEQSRVRIDFSGAGDVTLRIGLPQLELGAFATSVIPTTTTALTRSADVALVNTLSPWYNQTEGTVYAELQSLSPLTSSQSVALGKFPHLWHIEAGASDSNVFWYGLAAEAYISATYNNIGVVPSGINKFAITLAPSGGQARSSLNGAAAVNRNGTLTGTATGFFLGQNNTGGLNNFLNGYLRRITYYPRALSGAELAAITA